MRLSRTGIIIFNQINKRKSKIFRKITSNCYKFRSKDKIGIYINTQYTTKYSEKFLLYASPPLRRYFHCPDIKILMELQVSWLNLRIR